MNKEDLYRKAIMKWGEDLQVGMLTEELSELMIAVNKHRRNFNSITMSNLEGEIADTRIMIEQIIVMFNLDEVRIEIKTDEKLKKLENMLKKS